MKKLLLIILIMGCDNSTTEHTHEHSHDDEIKEVAWLWYHRDVNAEANMYYTQGYTPITIDTLNSNNGYYIRYSMGTHPDTVDVLESEVDSVGSIFHLVKEDVFHVYGELGTSPAYLWFIANSVPLTYFKYDYK